MTSEAFNCFILQAQQAGHLARHFAFGQHSQTPTLPNGLVWLWFDNLTCARNVRQFTYIFFKKNVPFLKIKGFRREQSGLVKVQGKL